jgi:hypothetical protein
MPAFFQNKYFKIIAIGCVVLFLGFVGFVVLLGSLNSARSVGLSGPAIQAPQRVSIDQELFDQPAMESDMRMSGGLPTPSPAPGGYISNLERYETTDYTIDGRTSAFDELCSLLTQLKADPRYEFQYLASDRDSCRGAFFVRDTEAATAVDQFGRFEELMITRTTQSVTRHREQLQGQTTIVRQQLANVERSLAAAEVDFDEIAAFARTNNDASTLSKALREKLSLIDDLTNRRIQLTSQLDQLYQSARELEDRINRTQVTVNLTRAFADDPGRASRAWEAAWRELRETADDTLIGVTAVFGIYLLWLVRLTLYGVVLLLLLRLLWKLVQWLWRM